MNHEIFDLFVEIMYYLVTNVRTKSVNLRMTFWCLKFSKKPTQKFDKSLPKNLKSGQIIKQRHSIIQFNLKIANMICKL